MDKNYSLMDYENFLFDELSALESVLKLTKNFCFEQEVNANYYNLNKDYQIKLSEERNNYLNLLTIALDKILLLKKISQSLEKEICSL